MKNFFTYVTHEGGIASSEARFHKKSIWELHKQVEDLS